MDAAEDAEQDATEDVEEDAEEEIEVNVSGEEGVVNMNPTPLQKPHGYFVAESRVYPQKQWMTLSSNQRKSVTQNKTASKWLVDGTSPSGFTLNEKGYAMISTYLVSAIQVNARNTKFTSTSGLVTLSPVPGPTPPINPIVITKSNHYFQ